MATPLAQGCQSDIQEQVEGSPQEQADIGVLKPAPPKGRGGFECEFVERPPGPDILQTDCPVCLLIVREPKQATCCGYSFCQTCIERVLTSKKPCPTCNKAEFSVFTDKRLQRSLYQLQVRCEHQKEGCDWSGELGQLDKHLNENPGLGNQLDGCEFTRVACIHCVQLFERHLVTAHQIGSCPRRPFSCDYCGDYGADFEDVVTNHWPVCGYRPVPCPNECGVYPERRNVHEHVNKDCPLTVVGCNFHYAGCQVRLPRRDILSHLNENLSSHMALLGAHSQQMAEMVMEKDEAIKRLTNVLSKELEENKLKIDELEKQNRALRTSLEQKGEEIAELSKKAQEALKREIAKLKEESKRAQEASKSVFKQELAELKAGKDETRRVQEASKRDRETLKQEIAQLREVAATNESELLKQEFTRQQENLKQKLSKKQEETLKQQVTVLVKEESRRAQEAAPRGVFSLFRKGATPSSDNEALKQEVAELSSKQEKLLSYVPTFPIDITMTDFEKHKRDDDIWYSDPFYTHPHGYRVCLGVVANGIGSAKGTHVSVFVCLMRGEFDNHLRWPLQAHFTIRLLNQLEDREHCEDTVWFSATSDPKNVGRVTSKERAEGWGVLNFLPNEELGHSPAKNCQYLKDDCLRFQVTRVSNLEYTAQLERRCLAIESCVYADAIVPPVDFTMTDFSQHKQNEEDWYSLPFYTHTRGYRMCVSVDANGNGDGEGTQVSVYVNLMQGEFDDHLKWPFRGDITIQLLNQLEDKDHHTRTINFTDETPDHTAGRVTTGERGESWGYYTFIAYGELNHISAKNCQYLKNDRLCFRVTKVKLKT